MLASRIAMPERNNSPMKRGDGSEMTLSQYVSLLIMTSHPDANFRKNPIPYQTTVLIDRLVASLLVRDMRDQALSQPRTKDIGM